MSGDVIVAPAEPEDITDPPSSRGSGAGGDRRGDGGPVLGGLLLLSFVGSLLISRFVFPHFSTNNDEPVYVVQARMLLEHHLTLPAAPHSEFFRPWMSGRIGDRLVMVFPPVLPALLALGEWLFGSMRVTLALLAAAGVLAVHRLTHELTGDRRAALYAAFILAICPFYLIQSGLFLAYVLAVDLELALAGFLVTGSRRGSLRWFVAAGGALGMLAFARPFDALLAGVPLVVVGVSVGGRHWRVVARRLAALAVGASPFVLASLTYNLAVTGDPLRLPLEAIGGDNAAGFGWRHVANGTPLVHYSISTALHAARVNLGSLPGWIPGGLVLVALAGLGAWRVRPRRWVLALGSLAVLFPAGYLIYWGNLLIIRGRKVIGPHYYMALLIPLVVFGAVGLATIARRQRFLGAALVVLMVATSGVALHQRIGLNLVQVALHQREVQLVDDADLHDALVILPSERPDGAWLGHPRPSFLNDPELEGPVLFATDHGGANFELFDDYRSRALYRQMSRSPAGTTPEPAEPVLWRLTSTTSSSAVFHVHVTNIDDDPVVTTFVTDGTRRISWVVDRDARLGSSYDLTWSFTPEGLTLLDAAEPPLIDDFGSPVGTGTLSVGVTTGPTEFQDGADIVEQRFWYRVPADGHTVEAVLPGEQFQRSGDSGARWRAQDVGPSFAVSVVPVTPTVVSVTPD